MYFKLLGRIFSIVSSLTITAQAIITLQAPTIADTCGMMSKKRIWTIYDSNISVNLTNATITGLTNDNAL